MWTVIVSDQRGQVVSTHEWQQGSLTIGRDQGRTIVLPTKTASRRHARLDLMNGIPVIVDEGSANGTLVNGARIAAPTRIDESSRVEVGEFRITLQRLEDDGERTLVTRPKPFASPPPPPSRPATPPSPPTVASMGAPSMPSMPSMPSVPAGPAAARSGNEVTSQFDRHLQSVRSYREETHAQTLNKRARLDAEWGRMIESARALQQRLATDKRVLSFAISRDRKELALKIADAYEKRGHRYFLLSREHPDGKFPGVDSVWLREFGRDDASFDDPHKAMEELMLRLAGTLA